MRSVLGAYRLDCLEPLYLALNRDASAQTRKTATAGLTAGTDMSGDPYQAHHYGCDCRDCRPQYYGPVTISSGWPSKPDVSELEREVIALRKELASTKAELFRLRNQQRRK